MNMLRHIVLAAALVIFGAGAARSACPGQTGKSIFADDFSDDSGGWELDANGSYAPGAFHVTATPKSLGGVSYNQTFSAADDDYCAVVAFPPDPPETGNRDFVAIALLGSTYTNRFQLTVYSDGTAVAYKLQSNNWLTLFDAKIPSINTSPGAENTLRVVVKDQKMTFFINGTQIKALRAQIPSGASKFGFSAGATAAVTKDRVYAIKSFSVTEAP